MTTNIKGMTEREQRLLVKSIRLATDNPNENEAMSAMLKAQEILLRHKLTIEDVNMTEAEKAQQRVVEVKDLEVLPHKKLQKWEKTLGYVISNNFRCYSYFNCIQAQWRAGLRSLRFVGLEDDVELAVKVYIYARDVMIFLAKQYCDTHGIKGVSQIKASKTSFYQGFIEGLKERFSTQVTEMSLVIVKPDAVIKREEEQALPVLKYKSRSKSQIDVMAVAIGFKEGKNMDHSNTNKLKY